MEYVKGIMSRRVAALALAIVLLAVPGVSVCGAAEKFSSDVAFLKKHVKVIVLEKDGGKVAVVPEYQGRVMTSTTGGAQAPSFGWLNYKLIAGGVLPPQAAKGKLEEHIYVFGGEERFWMGPEGGQFAIFFKPGAKFDFDNWYTPAVIDTEPFEVDSSSAEAATFTRDFQITNYSGTEFKVGIWRRIQVLGRKGIEKSLGVGLPKSVRAVGYESNNQMTNRGKAAWRRETGLLSICILGMYKPSPATTVVIPLRAGPESRLGPAVNDDYFGKVPAERLLVMKDFMLFRGDGRYRSKIGIGPQRARGIAGSYDSTAGVLNIVTYTVAGADKPYVNSMWAMQKRPYAGDVINSYNDGPPAPDKPPLGPFYELETSSPAAELEPDGTLTHIQRTFHIQGAERDLDPIARKLLGVSLAEIKGAFSK